MSDDLIQRLEQAANDRQLPQGISLMEIPKVFPGALEAEAAGALRRNADRIAALEADNEKLRPVVTLQHDLVAALRVDVERLGQAFAAKDAEIARLESEKLECHARAIKAEAQLAALPATEELAQIVAGKLWSVCSDANADATRLAQDILAAIGPAIRAAGRAEGMGEAARMADAADKSTHPADLAAAIRRAKGEG
jgi:hypothetical protein